MTDQECRQRALECVRLSQSSSDPRVRDKFAALAKTWITLAADTAMVRTNATTTKTAETMNGNNFTNVSPQGKVSPAISNLR
jgi:hypothetical protein